jgi:hypothetical protein
MVPEHGAGSAPQIRAAKFPPPTAATLAAALRLATHAVEAALGARGGMGAPAARLTVLYDREGSTTVWTELESVHSPPPPPAASLRRRAVTNGG